MNAATIRKLTLGDVVEWGLMFPGLSPEPMCWHLTQVPKGSSKTYRFEVTWHGSKVGTFYAKLQSKTKITWVKS